MLGARCRSAELAVVGSPRVGVVVSTMFGSGGRGVELEEVVGQWAEVNFHSQMLDAGGRNVHLVYVWNG